MKINLELTKIEYNIYKKLAKANEITIFKLLKNIFKEGVLSYFKSFILGVKCSLCRRKPIFNFFFSFNNKPLALCRECTLSNWYSKGFEKEEIIFGIYTRKTKIKTKNYNHKEVKKT